MSSPPYPEARSPPPHPPGGFYKKGFQWVCVYLGFWTLWWQLLVGSPQPINLSHQVFIESVLVERAALTIRVKNRNSLAFGQSEIAKQHHMNWFDPVWITFLLIYYIQNSTSV